MTQRILFGVSLQEYHQLRQFLKTLDGLVLLKSRILDRRVEYFEDGITTRLVWDGKVRVVKDGVVLSEREVAEPHIEVWEDGVSESHHVDTVLITTMGLINRIRFRPTAAGFRVDDDVSPVFSWRFGIGFPQFQEFGFDPGCESADELKPYFEKIRKWIKKNSKFDGSAWVFAGAGAGKLGKT